jgi:hypothetical protein
MDSAPLQGSAPSGAAGSAVYFDGSSNRRHMVMLAFKDRLELDEVAEPTIAWCYDDIRRADGPSGVLRLRCVTGPALARLEIRDASVASELISRCARLDEQAPGRHGVGAIIGWSLAAAASIVAVVLFGVPLAADRLTPLVPQALERRLGDAADLQVKAIFGDKVCNGGQGNRLSANWLIGFARPPGWTIRCRHRFWRHRSQMRSRCRAAVSICSAGCWRRPKTRMKSRACWRTNWDI